MIEKLKAAVNYVVGIIIAVLAILLFRQNRKTESAESALATEKAKEAVAVNDQERKDAHEKTEAADADYDALKSKYDAASHGAGGDSDL